MLVWLKFAVKFLTPQNFYIVPLTLPWVGSLLCLLTTEVVSVWPPNVIEGLIGFLVVFVNQIRDIGTSGLLCIAALLELRG